MSASALPPALEPQTKRFVLSQKVLLARTLRESNTYLYIALEWSYPTRGLTHIALKSYKILTKTSLGVIIKVVFTDVKGYI